MNSVRSSGSCVYSHLQPDPTGHDASFAVRGGEADRLLPAHGRGMDGYSFVGFWMPSPILLALYVRTTSGMACLFLSLPIFFRGADEPFCSSL